MTWTSGMPNPPWALGSHTMWRLIRPPYPFQRKWKMAVSIHFFRLMGTDMIVATLVNAAYVNENGSGRTIGTWAVSE